MQARAANPEIAGAESSVRLGLTAGYGSSEENTPPQRSESGALLGFEGGISALTPAPFGQYGWPDLYASANYGFSAEFFGSNGALQNGQNVASSASSHSSLNSAIVRLGLGGAVGGGTEIIPYAAGGYQDWHRAIGGAAGYGAYYQSGVLGGGIKIDMVATPLLVVSADAEGLAIIGAAITVPDENFSSGLGTSAEERVSLGADYRLTDAWHAFAGLGVTHYGYAGARRDALGMVESSSTLLQVNSTFGVAYGF